MRVERKPKAGETVKFQLNDQDTVGVYLRRGNGSAQLFWIVDIGSRRVWLWEYATFEVWDSSYSID